MHKNVLLIENNIEVIEPITAFLQSDGYHIISANNGCSAIKLFSVIPSDIVVLDFSISDMDGLEVIFQLRKLKDENDFFIIPVFANSRQYSQDCRDKLEQLTNIAEPLIAPYSNADIETLLVRTQEKATRSQLKLHESQ